MKRAKLLKDYLISKSRFTSATTRETPEGGPSFLTVSPETMPSKTDLQNLIMTHHRRLQKLKEQQALSGRSTEPEILIEIEDIEKALAELQGELEGDDLIEADLTPAPDFDDQPPQRDVNQILSRQNQKQFLQYLAAQRQLYDEEKRWMGIWTAATVSVAILGTGALAIFVPFTPYITLIAVLLIAGEFWVLSFIKKCGQDAAKIQEVFDCELLEMPWNDVLGAKAKPQTILAAAGRFDKQRNSAEWKKLKNWYTSSVGALPLAPARVACQKENIWWDSQLRREYARWVYLATVVFLIVIVLMGVIANWNLQQFFQGPLLLALPVLATGFKLAYDHQKAAERLDELHEFSERLWQEASSETANPDIITQRSRQLQDEIFRHRAEDPPIPSWFYKLRKKIYEDWIKRILGQ